MNDTYDYTIKLNKIKSKPSLWFLKNQLAMFVPMQGTFFFDKGKWTQSPWTAEHIHTYQVMLEFVSWV